MYVPYCEPDYNPPTGWLNLPIYSIVGQRPALSSDTKVAVNLFGDGDESSDFKHFVPYSTIYEKIEQQITRLNSPQSGLTRAQVIAALTGALKTLEIASHPSLNPQKSRVDFDTWVSWAIGSIADWPYNIYRWESEGDRRGTVVDQPIDPSQELKVRLTAAYKKLAGLGLTSDG